MSSSAAHIHWEGAAPPAAPPASAQATCAPPGRCAGLGVGCLPLPVPEPQPGPLLLPFHRLSPHPFLEAPPMLPPCPQTPSHSVSKSKRPLGTPQHAAGQCLQPGRPGAWAPPSEYPRGKLLMPLRPPPSGSVGTRLSSRRRGWGVRCSVLPPGLRRPELWLGAGQAKAMAREGAPLIPPPAMESVAPSLMTQRSLGTSGQHRIGRDPNTQPRGPMSRLRRAPKHSAQPWHSAHGAERG